MRQWSIDPLFDLPAVMFDHPVVCDSGIADQTWQSVADGPEEQEGLNQGGVGAVWVKTSAGSTTQPMATATEVMRTDIECS